jgi:hypothetical protein
VGPSGRQPGSHWANGMNEEVRSSRVTPWPVQLQTWQKEAQFGSLEVVNLRSKLLILVLSTLVEFSTSVLFDVQITHCWRQQHTYCKSQPLKQVKSRSWLGIMVHFYNPSSQEREAGRSGVWGQPWLYSETLYQKNKTRLYFSHRALAYLAEDPGSIPSTPKTKQQNKTQVGIAHSC